CNSLEDLSDMRMGFGVCSHAWGAGKGKPNSILLMQSRSGVVFEGQPDSSRLWRSSSNGSAYKLHWVEHESAIVSSGVTELVAVLRGIGLGVDSSVEENDGKRVIDFFDNNKNNSDGLLSVKAVLRKVAVERGFKGNEKARDNAIEVFVSELLEVFSERVLLSLDDKRLGDLYEDWLKSLKHLSKGERGEALLEFILNVRIPFSLYRIGRDRV
uniref:hypothetical protein n=1 Tax=uncultured Halomonas sp. TaxID=173971 RepID=UPI002601CA12